MTILSPAAAIKSEQRFFTARILSAAITIDGWPGAWSDDLAPAGVRGPLTMFTQS